MKTKFRMLVFAAIFVPVLLGGEYAAQAIGLLPRRSFESNLVKTVVVGIAIAIFFALWERRRLKRSSEAV